MMNLDPYLCESEYVFIILYSITTPLTTIKTKTIKSQKQI